MRTSQPSPTRRRRRRRTEPTVTAAVVEAPAPWEKLYKVGKPKDCKYRGVIKSCFGTFKITKGNRLTCDNPACKKRLRKDTHDPAVRKYNADPANRATTNTRRKRNYPATKDRINKLRRDATAANRKLKPCEITNIDDAKLPTAGLRAAFAEARKTCLGEFFPNGKQQTCSKPCSDALAKLGAYKRQRKSDAKNKAKINATKRKRRARNKAAGRGRDVGARSKKG